MKDFFYKPGIFLSTIDDVRGAKIGTVVMTLGETLLERTNTPWVKITETKWAPVEMEPEGTFIYQWTGRMGVVEDTMLWGRNDSTYQELDRTVVTVGSIETIGEWVLSVEQIRKFFEEHPYSGMDFLYLEHEDMILRAISPEKWMFEYSGDYIRPVNATITNTDLTWMIDPDGHALLLSIRNEENEEE